MKQFILTAIISLFLFQSAKADDIKSYYSEINRAEMSITVNDYKNAIHQYDLAFKNKKQPFAQDIFNQTVCYIKMDNFKKAMNNCFILAEKGTGSEFFQKNKIFEPLKKQEKWQQLLNTADNKKKELTNKNKELNEKLTTLHTADQEAHTLLRTMNEQNEDSVSNYVKMVDDSLSKKLMKIFKQYGLLSEFNLGVTLDDKFRIKDMPGFYIVMLHNFQGLKHYDSLFSPILKEAVFSGKVKPNIYASMFDGNVHEISKFYGTSGLFWLYNNKLYIEKGFSEPELKNQINNQRASLMLSTIDDYERKIIFRLKNPNSGFDIDAGISRIGSFGNKESEQSFLNSLKLISDDF